MFSIFFYQSCIFVAFVLFFEKTEALRVLNMLYTGFLMLYPGRQISCWLSPEASLKIRLWLLLLTRLISCWFSLEKCSEDYCIAGFEYKIMS